MYDILFFYKRSVINLIARTYTHTKSELLRRLRRTVVADT